MSIKTQTPYQGWYRTKPNILHLCEFRTPVWVLLQGQNITCKILPKSKCHAYVRYTDALKSVLYYNAETRKILTSCNYVFLTAKELEAPKQIQVEQDTPMRKGE
jgi:hypothetical protein